MLVQLTQAEQREASPPFLPTTQIARRQTDRQVSVQVLGPGSPLLDGLVGPARYRPAVEGPVDLFAAQGGFEVALSADGNGANAAADGGGLRAGAHRAERAMAPDKPVGGGPDRDQFNQAFFRNLSS